LRWRGCGGSAKGQQWLLLLLLLLHACDLGAQGLELLE